MTLVSNTSELPKNVGIDGKFGKGESTGLDERKMYDVSAGLLHIWRPMGYLLYTFDKNLKRYTYTSSHRMMTCMEEQKYGFCRSSHDENHTRYYYHYLSHVDKDGDRYLPVCKYSHKECWNRYGSEHNKTFAHPM